MSRLRMKLAIGVALLGAGATTAVAIGSDGEKLRTGLSGLEENPAVITTGQGSFTATLSSSGRTIDYEMTYDGLEGGEVRQAHIHAGQMTANGGIVAWLCQSATNPAPVGVDVATCATPSGTVTGTIDAADVQAATSVPAQGFRADADKFDKLVTALRAGVAYANVHTATSPGGEIRGQLVDRQDD
jgi:CHRD domain